jgi:hypothetical protein
MKKNGGKIMRDNVARSGNAALQAVRARVSAILPRVCLQDRMVLIMATVGVGIMTGDRLASGVSWLAGIVEKMEKGGAANGI